MGDVNSDDFYKVLGVEKSADDKAIAKAYKKAALKWHPDKNPDNKEAAEEKFKKVTEAYEVLSDKEKRKMYDQFGKAAFEQGGGGGPGAGPGGMHFSSGGPGMSFNDADAIFRAFFGGGDPFDGGFGGGPGGSGIHIQFGGDGFGPMGMGGGGPMGGMRMGGDPFAQMRGKGGGRGGGPHQQQAVQQGPNEIPIGQKVIIQNLQTQAQHNERAGTIQSYDKEKNRYLVALSNNQTLSLTPDKLALEVEGVTLTNISSKPALNGKKGKILKYDREKDRYTVQVFEENTVIAIPTASVILPKRTAVQVVGLTGATQYNEKWGTIASYDPNEEKYTVQLTKDRSLKLKRGNCRAAG
ncbi:unnamed protein product [Amoebophrya sp. A120]|nr:unnamed protein product [Amoebophrya sp. A120]|eukprot:GSA120T00002076001.1